MKCSTAFCNRPAPMPSLEVPAPFCEWCRENPGSGRIKDLERVLPYRVSALVLDSPQQGRRDAG